MYVLVSIHKSTISYVLNDCKPLGKKSDVNILDLYNEVLKWQQSNIPAAVIVLK